MKIYIDIKELKHISELEAILKWLHNIPVKNPTDIEVDSMERFIIVQPFPKEKKAGEAKK